MPSRQWRTQRYANRVNSCHASGHDGLHARLGMVTVSTQKVREGEVYMAEGFVTFEYFPSGHPSTIPEWQWGASLTVRISLEDLLRICGPTQDLSPDLVVARNRPVLDRAISGKLRGETQRLPEPITLSFSEDFQGQVEYPTQKAK
jgi:hypothetical protein